MFIINNFSYQTYSGKTSSYPANQVIGIVLANCHPCLTRSTSLWSIHFCSIGYPVVTLGYGVKSYVGYKMRQVRMIFKKITIN